MFILICGLPRAGKTTYSQEYIDKYPIIHLDNCGANPYDGVERRIKRMVDDIVVEGVYNRKSERIRILSHRKDDENKICIWLDTPQEVRQTRKGWRKDCDFPFEPPTFDEGWDEIIIIRGEHDVQSYRNEKQT